MAFFTVPELIALAQSAGFTGDDATIAGAVAMAESGGDPMAHAVTSREDSRGLWQINTFAHPGADAARLYDPTYNSQVAKSTFDAAKASKATGYNGWQPWSVYTTTDPKRSYKRFMPAGPSTGTTAKKSLLVPVAIGVGVLGVATVAAILIRRQRAHALVP